MLNNLEFLQTIKDSFITCLETSERSTAKLKILHGNIAQDISDRLNAEENKYFIASQGFDVGKERKILGRYIDKAIDITVVKKSTNKAVAGIAVKFVMSNYSQNSNNYFENMLGETANIRSANVPYFQIFIIPDTLPYYKKDGILSRWEKINDNYLKKYLKLSEDNIDCFMHTPNKTLLFIVHIPSVDTLSTKEEVKNYYLNSDFTVETSDLPCDFGGNIIYNDYEQFAKKLTHLILSI